MAVLNPLKLIIDNYPEDLVEEMDAINNPEDPEAGTRKVPFSKELWIEAADFMEVPVRQFHRLAPGAEVRLRYAYLVKCVSVDKDADGNVVALHCTYDPASRGGNAPDGRKVKGTIHWLSAKTARKAKARLYDRLFTIENVGEIPDDEDYRNYLNSESLKEVDCLIEPALAHAQPGVAVQFERTGYFCPDIKDSTPELPVFNRTVPLKDSWQKKVAQQ